MKRVLFVSWDGADSPYLETLFFPVFRGLAKHGFEFHVLHFTWGSKEYVRRLRDVASRVAIGYRNLPILRGPAVPSALAMISAGALAVRAHAKWCRADIVMPRSILPAAMTLLARRGAPWALAFDADGLAADERVEFARWSASGVTYRFWREIEAQAVRLADVVVTRTAAAKPILIARAGAGVAPDKILVIANARDSTLFSPGTPEDRAAMRAEWGVASGAPCLIFAGSIGPQYYPDEMLSLYARVVAQRDDARIILLSHDRRELSVVLRRARVPEKGVIARSVPPSEMPRQLAAADLGLALRAPTFSQRAVSPIKVGEYLLCGVPAITTPVGDVVAQIEDGSGLVVGDPSEAELDRVAAFFVNSVLPRREDFRRQSREVGLRHFGLEASVRRYAEALGRCRSHAP